MLRTRTIAGYGVAVAALTAALLVPGLPASRPAHAAGETVDIWLTTTSDSGGRAVTRGLQQQAPITFGPNTGSGTTVNVDEGTTYQQFDGAGASMTDTTAWLLRGSGAVSAATRDRVLRDLFDPVNGIGVSFLRNPMGASDLARFTYSFDDTCCDVNDFTIAPDADVLALTKQAKSLNPAVRVMGSPWSAPAWMKDNNSMIDQGWLKAEYYGTYAQYFVKYIQAYAAQGVRIDYVSPQNEPTCCGPGTTYPSMNWNSGGLIFFTKDNLWPAFRAAGITTKTLVLDFNWSNYAGLGAAQLADAAIRNDPLFGGIAWHGYGGDVATQTTVHNQYPGVQAYDTEHSGGTWISNQHSEDMHNLIDYTRNWGRTWVKWSLGVDQNMGPHNGGCGTCTGLITVHNGDSRSGQVDYTVEYYTMGHLTKFVKPGAYRIASTASGTIPNVAWKNPDGSKALIAYNGGTSSQPLKVVWGNQAFVYTLPARTSATFTWSGTPGSGGGGGGTGATGPISGYGGKCVDVAGASTANGAAVQLYDCNGTAAQQWTMSSDGTVRALGKCMDVTGGSTADGAQVQLYDCNGSGAQQWTYTAGRDLVNPQSGKCLDATGPSSANGTRLQIWACTGGANQKWTVPS
ncbi:ricin-type beta-trefoil lectin domain protein [Flindersiella endophytica]